MKPGAGQHPESSDREVLAGLVERVTFHNPENGFWVLRTKARGHRDLVTVVGHAAMVGPGEWITASGEWVNDRTHGQQFKARFMRTSEPSSVEGIEKYLGSGMIRGIGPVYARKLVRAFGEKLWWGTWRMIWGRVRRFAKASRSGGRGEPNRTISRTGKPVAVRRPTRLPRFSRASGP